MHDFQTSKEPGQYIMGHLAGKVAAVTGASKGIGAGIAKELAAHGAKKVQHVAQEVGHESSSSTLPESPMAR